MLGQYPKIEEIFQPAVQHTKRDQRLQFLGNDGIAGIDMQMGRWHLVEDDRVVGILRAGDDRIAKADVDLDWATGVAQPLE